MEWIAQSPARQNHSDTSVNVIHILPGRWWWWLAEINHRTKSSTFNIPLIRYVFSLTIRVSMLWWMLWANGLGQCPGSDPECVYAVPLWLACVSLSIRRTPDVVCLYSFSVVFMFNFRPHMLIWIVHLCDSCVATSGQRIRGSFCAPRWLGGFVCLVCVSAASGTDAIRTAVSIFTERLYFFSAPPEVICKKNTRIGCGSEEKEAHVNATRERQRDGGDGGGGSNVNTTHENSECGVSPSPDLCACGSDACDVCLCMRLCVCVLAKRSCLWTAGGNRRSNGWKRAATELTWNARHTHFGWRNALPNMQCSCSSTQATLLHIMLGYIFTSCLRDVLRDAKHVRCSRFLAVVSLCERGALTSTALSSNTHDGRRVHTTVSMLGRSRWCYECCYYVRSEDGGMQMFFTIISIVFRFGAVDNGTLVECLRCKFFEINIINLLLNN